MSDSLWRCARCDLPQPLVLDHACPRCGCWWLARDGTWKHVGGPNWPNPEAVAGGAVGNTAPAGRPAPPEETKP
jgi:hypothetical protein